MYGPSPNLSPTLTKANPHPLPQVDLSGYAWSGGGRGIVRVEVSADGGETWVPASLSQPTGQPLGRMWAWTLWSATLPLPKGVKRGETL